MNITDFERGLLYGWTCHAEMPIEIRNIIKKICNPAEQFESVYEGDDLNEFISKARISSRVATMLKQNGYTSLDSLMREPDVQLLRIPNFGRGSLNELLYSYKRFGLVGRRAELLAKRNKQ